MPAPAGAAPAIDGLSDFEILGQGGFACVYAVRRLSDGLSLAVKVARSRDDQRLLREASLLARLGTPLTPALLGQGRTRDGFPYLSMELLSGRTLGEWMARQPGAGPPRGEALSLFVRLCRCVNALHEAGVVHRDLKPDNVFIRSDQVLCVLDLGLACPFPEPADPRTAERLTLAEERLGTLFYMSPEQYVDARVVDPRSDIYSLGVILFELLTHRPPFVGDAAALAEQHLALRPPRPSQFRPDAAAYDEVVARCLAKERERRIESAAALASALEGARERASPTAAWPALRQAASQLEPVALLTLRPNHPIPQVASIAARLGGTVARLHGDRCVLAFADNESVAAGVRAALRAGEALTAHGGADAVVHVADLRVRRNARGLMLLGAELDGSPAWKTVRTMRNIGLTLEAARWMPTEEEAPAASEELVPLVGRASELAALSEHLAATVRDKSPRLITILDELGTGKTRLLDAFTEKARTAGARVLRLCASSPATVAPALDRELLRLVLGLSSERVGVEEVRAACDRALRPALAEAAWPAVALTLEALSESSPDAQPMVGVPGALRAAVAQAAAEALARLARAESIVLIVDDAHWADLTTLDALEVATMAGATGALLVAVGARPELTSHRPSWGSRAARGERLVPGPLDRLNAEELMHRLLIPVQQVPQPVRERLWQLSNGIPLHLIELVRALRAGGAIRRHPGEGGWYLAADELLHATGTPLAERLARRVLDTLAPSLVALAQLCAIAGEVIDRDQIELIQRELASAHESQYELDVGVGLKRLSHAGVLVSQADERWRFRHSMLRDSIAACTPAPLRRQLHGAAWAALRHLAVPAAKLAHHAAAAGARDEGAALYLQAGEQARRSHQYVEADQAYSLTLELVGTSDATTRRLAHAGRGKVRYRVERFADTLDDLREARRLAEAAHDASAMVDLLLEEATVLDWLNDFDLSGELAEQAAREVAALEDPALAARTQMALGRTSFRKERQQDAVRQLADAARRARGCGDHETHTIALLLLGVALSYSSRFEEAEACYRELFEDLERVGDQMHLAAAYSNRIILWVMQGEEQRAAEDLEHAISISHRLGNGKLESMASQNLAVLLLAKGQLDEALALARRARSRGIAVEAKPNAYDTLFVARILAARSDWAELAEHVGWLAKSWPPDTLQPSLRAQFNALELLLAERTAAGGRRDWSAVLDEIRKHIPAADERLEMFHLAIRSLLEQGHKDDAHRLLDEARCVQGALPSWKGRLDELEALLSSLNSE